MLSKAERDLIRAYVLVLSDLEKRAEESKECIEAAGSFHARVHVCCLHRVRADHALKKLESFEIRTYTEAGKVLLLERFFHHLIAAKSVTFLHVGQSNSFLMTCEQT